MSSRPASSAGSDPRVRRGMETQLAERRRRLDAGERPLGWKVGFGTEEAMARFGTDAPLVGYMTDRSLLAPGASVSLERWANPVLEPEVAVRVGADLPGGRGGGEAKLAIGAVAPAFELVDVNPPPEDVEAILAGNIFHRSVVLGPTVTMRELDELSGLVTLADGSTLAVEDPQAATGELVDIVRHVADLLDEMGETLRAGETIICGSIVPPIQVAPGEEVSYRLDPLGEISIRFRPD
jgi:2-keto-4-pentenoate hydratase